VRSSSAFGINAAWLREPLLEATVAAKIALRSEGEDGDARIASEPLATAAIDAGWLAYRPGPVCVQTV